MNTPVTWANTPATTVSRLSALRAGLVGEYAGDVGEYAGDVGDQPLVGDTSPSMMFSETPRTRSVSANMAASIRMSTVSSKEQRISGARVDAVDAVARDGEQVAAEGHHVAQDGEVAVVDVRAVELDHGAQLAEQRLANRLDAEDADDLDDVVRRAARVVDLRSAHMTAIRLTPSVSSTHSVDIVLVTRPSSRSTPSRFGSRMKTRVMPSTPRSAAARACSSRAS